MKHFTYVKGIPVNLSFECWDTVGEFASSGTSEYPLANCVCGIISWMIRRLSSERECRWSHNSTGCGRLCRRKTTKILKQTIQQYNMLRHNMC